MGIDFDNVENLTADQILSEEAIDYIYSEEDLVRRSLIITKFRKRATKLKVKTDFNLILKSADRQIKAEKAEEAKKKSEQIIPAGNVSTVSINDDNTIFVNTGKWVINESGVYANGVYGPIVACNYPIIITKRFIDRETQKVQVEIAWKREGVTHYFRTMQSVISVNTKIVALSDYGVPVTSESSRNLVEFFSDYEKLNPDLISTKECTSKCGWANGEFVPYSTCGGGDGIELNVPPSFNTLKNAIREAGDPDLWMDTVKKIRSSGRQEPLSYLAASFGSILIPIANIPPFICNLYGETGKGKTVNLMLAASIWGEPKSYLTESTSTINSMEQRLNILNNLPMMIDDLSKIHDQNGRDKFTDLIYTICAGRGKGRLNKNVEMRETATWANIVLTNIERPLATDTMQGGAINRVLDFEIQPGNIFKDGNAVVTTISSSYGHAGKMFVDVVISHRQEIPEMISGYEKKIREIAESTEQEKEEKQIKPLAVLLTADELAEKYIFQDGVRMDVNFAVSMLKDVNSVSEMDRALENLRDEIVINWNKFHVNNFCEYKGEVWGEVNDNYVAVITSVLREIANKHNFDCKQFTNWCNDKGILITEGKNGDKRNTKRVNIAGLGKFQRCYVFKFSEEDDVYKGPQEQADQQGEKSESKQDFQLNTIQYEEYSENSTPFD